LVLPFCPFFPDVLSRPWFSSYSQIVRRLLVSGKTFLSIFSPLTSFVLFFQMRCFLLFSCSPIGRQYLFSLSFSPRPSVFLPAAAGSFYSGALKFYSFFSRISCPEGTCFDEKAPWYSPGFTSPPFAVPLSLNLRPLLFLSPPLTRADNRFIFSLPIVFKGVPQRVCFGWNF